MDILNSHMVRAAGDITSATVIFSSMMQYIPPVSGIIAIAWVLFQWYHHPVIKEWRQRRKEKNGRDS